jgi:hypothetical protein
MVAPNDLIEISSEDADIIVNPSSFIRGDDTDSMGVSLKIVRLSTRVPNLSTRIIARWKGVQSEMEVMTSERNVLTPVDGLEFDRDEYHVRLDAHRHLRLFVDTKCIPIGSEILVSADTDAIELSFGRVVLESSQLVTPQICELKIPVKGIRIRDNVIVTAAVNQFATGTKISVVKREKPERGKGGLFSGYRFQPLERKVQTQWLPDGLVLVNTKDPVNYRYFGDDPGKSVEDHTYCQVRLADLILNECLQIMVSQALENGRLDRRFPNNPEIDLRNYVDEKKYDIGAAIHEKFVTTTTKE